MSRLWGQFNQLELPVWLRKPALGLYVWMFNCTLEDAAVQDLKRYRNLSEFFRRRLRAGIRPIDGAHILVCVVHVIQIVLHNYCQTFCRISSRTNL